jgi:hypothetical protein
MLSKCIIFFTFFLMLQLCMYNKQINMWFIVVYKWAKPSKFQLWFGNHEFLTNVQVHNNNEQKDLSIE